MRKQLGTTMLIKFRPGRQHTCVTQACQRAYSKVCHMRLEAPNVGYVGSAADMSTMAAVSIFLHE